MKVIIAGGGTGGHLFPAVAVGEELKRQRAGCAVLYVGASDGFEARWLPQNHLDHRLFRVHGVLGHGVLGAMRSLAEFVRALFGARRLVADFAPDLAVSAGGYASAAVALAALTKRVPLVLMEQNTRPGLSNRILWRLARRVCVGFPSAASSFAPGKVVVTGNPVLFEPRGEPLRSLGDSLQIIVLGGSTGAHRLNLGVLKAFGILGKHVIKFAVVHQTGEADRDFVRAGYAALGLSAQVLPFIDNVAEALERAELVIARAGAVTVSEVAMAARAAIFVPYPFHRDRQQEHNASVLERRGAALIVHDDENLGENLAHTIAELAAKPSRIIEMGARAREEARPGAAARIAQMCLQIVEESELKVA